MLRYKSRLPPAAVSAANQLQARPATISNTAETTNNGFDAEANARPTTLEPPRPSTPKTDAAAPGNIAVIAPQPTTMPPAPTPPSRRATIRRITRPYFEPWKTCPTTKRLPTAAIKNEMLDVGPPALQTTMLAPQPAHFTRAADNCNTHTPGVRQCAGGARNGPLCGFVRHQRLAAARMYQPFTKFWAGAERSPCYTKCIEILPYGRRLVRPFPRTSQAQTSPLPPRRLGQQRSSGHLAPPQSHRSGRAGSDDPVLHRVHRGARPVRHAQLAVDVLDVVADRLRADPQLAGDAFVGHPLG